MTTNENVPSAPDPGHSHHYIVHGLCVASSLTLPELTQAQEGYADVDIREVNVPASLGEDATAGDYWQARGDQFLFEVPGVARYLVSGGRSVRFQPDSGRARDNHAIRLYLLGTALGVLLHQRGLFPLHASGVVTPAGAWLFTGHSGAGKSTLVAWLHRRFGWPILGDDVTVVDCYNGAIRAHRGAARLRLWRDALAALSIPEAGLVRDLMRFDKYQLLIGEGYGPPLPLRGLILLEACEGDASTLTQLHGHDALAAVIGSTYRPEFAELWCRPGDFFLRGARIAAGIQVFRFSRPRSLTDYDRHLQALITGLDAGPVSPFEGVKPADTNTETTL